MKENRLLNGPGSGAPEPQGVHEAVILRERVTNACREVWAKGQPALPTPVAMIPFPPELVGSKDMETVAKNKLHAAVWDLRAAILRVGVDPSTGRFHIEPAFIRGDGVVCVKMLWVSNDAPATNGEAKGGSPALVMP